MKTGIMGALAHALGAVTAHPTGGHRNWYNKDRIGIAHRPPETREHFLALALAKRTDRNLKRLATWTGVRT